MAVYITGDIHGDATLVRRMANHLRVTKDDTIVLLGDVGINFCFAAPDPGYAHRDSQMHKILNEIGCTIFCIHGNHEERAWNIPTYERKEWHGGYVWSQPTTPRVMFAQDGCVYDLEGFKVAVWGGAFSIDKDWRLVKAPWSWFPEEQMSAEAKQFAEEQMDKCGWQVDAILTHTCPHQLEPVDMYLPSFDQSKVDKTMEIWLDTMYNKTQFQHWYCGHWHLNRDMDQNKMHFLYHDYRCLNNDMAEQENIPAGN